MAAEFQLSILTPDRTVFEGAVAATNSAGSVRIGPGQSAVAEAGKGPGVQNVVRPGGAVQREL